MMSAAVRSVVLGALRRGVPAWVPSGASMDFDFANGRGFNSIDRAKLTPDSILTYTSPSPKMVYGNDGVLRYAPHNLLTYSEQFNNAAWTALGGGYVVTANATAAPNGTMTADKLVSDVTTSTHNLGAENSPVAAVHTFSIYAKAAELSTLQLFVSGASMGFVNFDLSSGTVGTSSLWSGSIQKVGSGWYRCIAVTNVLTAFSNSTWRVALTNSSSASRGQNFTRDGTSGIYIWGAQLNLGASALTYLPTTTAAVYSLPIDHNPTTFAPLGVLIEEQRTNLLTYSEQFDNAAWVKSNSSVAGASINAIVAPNGTLTADKLVEGVGTTRKCISQSGATENQTFSLYAKKGERNYVAIGQTNNGGLWAVSLFDLNLGTYVNSYEAGTQAVPTNNKITPVGDSWYRISCTLNGSALMTAPVIMVSNGGNPILEGYTGNGTSGVYIWGAQLEAGAFATSYIPTVASQVTRAADQVSILTSAFAYNAAAGTVVAEVRAANLSVSRRIAVLYNDASNRIALNLDNGSQLFVRTLGSTVASVDGGTFTVGQSDKVAVAFTTDDYVATVNGAAVGVDPDGGAMPSGITVLQVGNQAGIEQTNGHIKRLTYFPVRKTNAELVVLST